MGTVARRHGVVILRQRLLEEPMILHRARVLIADRRGLDVSEMTDHEVIDQLERHGTALLSTGLGDCDCSLGEEWSQIIAVGPFKAAIAMLQADASITTAENLCDERGWSREKELTNGRADAFRHCYWLCLMAKAIGALEAFLVGTTHECCVKNSEEERTMDLHNNEVGRSLGVGFRRVFKGDCKNDCLKALDDGYLITSLGGAAKSMPGSY